jgi:hypothetical protein
MKMGISLEMIKQNALFGFVEEVLEAIFYLRVKAQFLIGEFCKIMNMN